MTRLFSRFLVSLFFLAPVLLVGSDVSAQERENTVPRVSPNAVVSQTVGVTNVKITYGRPSVRGRQIFGGLVPFGEVWRAGANEATTISFSTPVEIQGEPLDSGTYGFFTIPGPDSWTLIFNKEANQWGAYNYDASEDVLRVEAEPEPADSRELMTFSFHNVTDTSATAMLHWADTRIPFDIAVNTVEVLRTRADSVVANAENWQAPLQYVGYVLQNDVLLDEAVDWVNRSIELDEHFGNLRLKAEVLAARGEYEQAIETANAALSKAESMEDSPDGVDDLRSSMNEWESER